MVSFIEWFLIGILLIFFIIGLILLIYHNWLIFIIIRRAKKIKPEGEFRMFDFLLLPKLRAVKDKEVHKYLKKRDLILKIYKILILIMFIVFILLLIIESYI